MAGLTYSREGGMGGAQVRVPPQSLCRRWVLAWRCYEKAVFCCKEAELPFFIPAAAPERTKCGCWTGHGPAVIALPLASPPSGGASLVFTTSRLHCPCCPLSLASLLGYHNGNVIPKISWDCIARCIFTFAYNWGAIANNLFWSWWDKYCHIINRTLTLEGKKPKLCLLQVIGFSFQER